tara:strand:- start:1515 stop:1757 length:243 start_codon:yes stop_codon:yes gene_type:complete
MRDQFFKITITYDYEKDKTVLTIEDKFKKLPRIIKLNTILEAQELLNNKYVGLLDTFDTHKLTQGEENAIEKRYKQESVC